MSYINEQLLTTTLIIDPKDLHNDIDNIIKYKLKEKYEGKCHEDGYIIKDSIIIIKRSIGKVSTNNGKSSIKYIITYKAKIINPSEGDEFNVFVQNINKMGVIAYIKINEKKMTTPEDSPLIIMIPNEYFEGSSKNIDDLTIGQSIQIKVIGYRIKYQSDKIQVIARPL